MRLLDAIRRQRTQIRRALQPAPAGVEGVLLLKDDDIKTLLHKEIAAAQQSGDGPWPSMKKAQREASQVFQPVLDAMHHLAQEVAGNEHITVTMRDNDVELAIGHERRIRASRYGWHRDFTVADTIYCPDLGESFERTYAFQTPEDVITFLIRACAEFLARQP